MTATGTYINGVYTKMQMNNKQKYLNTEGRRGRRLPRLKTFFKYANRSSHDVQLAGN